MKNKISPRPEKIKIFGHFVDMEDSIANPTPITAQELPIKKYAKR